MNERDIESLANGLIPVVREMIQQSVGGLGKRLEALESRPAPERGEKGDRGDSGETGPAGREGVGVRDAFLQREGVLVLTLTDGTTRELGMVVGKDGERGPPGEAGPPGEKGEKGDPGERGSDGATGEKGADGLPGEAGQKGDPGEKGETGEKGDPGTDGRDGLPGEKGKDGAAGRDGKDGRDGFKLEDFGVAVLDDDRTIELSFQGAEHRYVSTLKWPTVIDRGVFKADREPPYAAGDGVTWGGSYWIAQRETSAKPDTAESGWRLAVKKGRDGKDAKAA